MSDEVLVERHGAVQVIVINRPEARNALNRAVAVGIRDAVDELDATPELRAGVLTGAAGTFSSGMDLKAFLRGERPSFPGRGLCGITQTPPRKPLVGAAEGWALAGGFELLLACDLVVAGASARFGVPEVKRGLLAGAGGAMMLAQRIPRALALEMLLTGDPVDAARAAAIGLVDEVDDDVDAAVDDLAAILAGRSGVTQRAVKQTVARVLDGATADDDTQAALRDAALASPDYAEGVSAFLERRPPKFE